MGITPLAFTGVSKFSNDFQTILSRSVSIASLPAKLLENEQKQILDKKMAMAEMRTAVADFSSSLAKLGAGGALTATSSSSALTATVGSGAAAGSYQISDITSLASAAIATTTAGFATSDATQVSTTDHKLQIVVGGVTETIELTAGTDNLEGVRDAINELNLGVTAGILDSHQSPQRYFLSLTATSPGARSIELRTVIDDPLSDLTDETNPGSNAAFKVNGIDVTVTDNFVSSVIPGVNLELKELTEPDETITVTVSANRAPVTTALQEFVDAFNALTQKVDSHIGQSAGMLSGDPIILGISDRMRGVTGFQGSGTFRNLADLGITLDSAGTMSFDNSVIDWMAASDMQHVFELLGDGVEGLSGLESHFTELSDPITGFMRQQLASYDATDSRLAKQVADITERVNAMQSTMMARLQAADAMLASLEGQQNMLTATIDSLNLVTNGRQDG